MATYRFTGRIEISGEIEVTDEVMDTENEPSPDALQSDVESIGVTVDFDGDTTWDIAGHPVRATLSGYELQDVDVGEAGH